MQKLIILILLLASTNIYSQDTNDDYLQDDLTFENPYRNSGSIQEQEELYDPNDEPNEYFLTEEEAYNVETEYQYND